MWARSAALSANLLLGATLFAASPVLPEGPGKKTLESACTTCHALDIVASKKYGWEKWRDVVGKMNVRLSKEETEDVVGYLSRHFGPKERGQQLVEQICSFCHELARLQGHEYTRDQWENLTKVMISEGAPITEQESSLILDYLAKNYGPSKQGKQEK